MAFDDGTLILVDYTARVKDGKVFETTVEEDAKEHGLYRPSVNYQPKLITVGERQMLKGFDEEIVNASVGDRRSIEVAPDKAFGERDSGKIRMVPLRKLGEDAEKASVGDAITIDGRRGVIRLVGSGRVQIDFNHQYAGKTIVYDINVTRSLDTDGDKILYTARHHFGPDYSETRLEKSGDTLNVSIPDSLFRADNLQTLKRLLLTELFKHVPSLQTIRFIETNENPIRKIVPDTAAQADGPATDAPSTPSSDAPNATRDADPAPGADDGRPAWEKPA